MRDNAHSTSERSTAVAAAAEEASVNVQTVAATQEIARNVEQASIGTSEVTSNIASVTDSADETGNAAEQRLDASGELSRQSDLLSTQVQGFLDKIRAD